MNPASRLPLAFQGELHDIYLVNFTVDPQDLLNRFGPLPKPFKPRLRNGRALISMVDVHLRNMRVQSKWLPFRFHYQHVAFRLLLEDGSWTDDHDRNGIFFLKSFTNRPLIATGGNWLTNFNFQTARIDNYPGGMRLHDGSHFIAYNVDGPLPPNDPTAASTATVGRIDRAYAIEKDQIWETRILRERWPLQSMHCNHFSTDFFQDARLESVHKVAVPIAYTWLPPRLVAAIHTPAPATAAPKGVSLSGTSATPA
jgi:uncharacterized protein YqjF (DUF2071 family)